ncbi:hypothetical protein TWF569_011775 [Orbilia oligospora]|uniref:Altered inheritance of mitochondria protein 41 n=1 Tax=Orbilia oligospora TaxID=2813651 RepID=A0A7C8NCB7_ORBOL|nr:hypothetical protein TWF102_004435 [Orbilia oligospora]KAF3110367.1 hypothetical protein TWF103_004654 [Orbilia oligospora]KAF3127412.1 hypothetical protein TWF569_011775 [Orbilia oligospora]
MFGTRRLLVSRSLSRQFIRAYSEAAAAQPAPPALLLALRQDLKTAMKAKDKEKLNVVKAILAEISNAGMAQPPRPVKNDMDILKILQSMEKKHNVAIDSFKTAERQDLVDKEQLQLDIVKEYSGRVEVLVPEKIAEIVDEVVAKLKQKDNFVMNMGMIIRDATARIAELGGNASGAEISAAAKRVVDAEKAQNKS